MRAVWFAPASLLIAASGCATVRPADAPPAASLGSLFGESSTRRLEGALSSPDCVWTSDADGTLWSNDIGEGFLQQLIADHALVSPEAQGVDVWQSYQERVEKDRGAGYAWAAQVMAGMPSDEVARRADAYARDFVPKHLHPEMKALIDAARERGCTLWIVSASAEAIVKAGAGALGLPPEHALGIRTTVQDGRYTAEVVPPVTYKGGKPEAIQQFIGRRPALATGDSSGDTEMLDAAQTGLLMVHPGKTDPALTERARQDGWLTHDLPPGR